MSTSYHIDASEDTHSMLSSTSGAHVIHIHTDNDKKMPLLQDMNERRANDVIQFDSLKRDPQTYKNQKRAIRDFYDKQNEILDGLKQIASLPPAPYHHGRESSQDDVSSARTEQEENHLVHRTLQWAVVITLVLVVIKFAAAGYSGSMAIIASAIDSGLDILSQSTLLVTSSLMRKRDMHKYPVGKRRMEPLALLVFSVIMAMAALELLYQSIQVVMGGDHSIRMDAVSITLLVVSMIVQVFMYAYCQYVYRLTNSGSVLALAQDNFNDIILGLIGGVPAIAAGNDNTVWWLDPAAAIVVSCWIGYRWVMTLTEQIPQLIGRTAPPELIGKLTYLASVHHIDIIRVDTVLAYEVGSMYQCEVHIVLPALMPLRLAHDIGESLEMAIEAIDEIELAFVHLDYEWTHRPEHKLRK